MKFHEGALDDAVPPAGPERTPSPHSPPALPGEGHLFETLEEEKTGTRKYIKLFAVVVLLVVGAGIAGFYLMIPGVGDRIRMPASFELQVRDHFLTVEKRTAADIAFFQCNGYISARVGVETRSDMPNPVFRLNTYSARIIGPEGQLQITATPVPANEQFAPCR